jgi:predicted nuclease of predicted toxin-antitoxin system
MNLYLDGDSVHALLVTLLRKAGHDVIIPAAINCAGRADPEHFAQAIAGARVLLTHNDKDFSLLHELVQVAGGHHPGVFVVRKDNDKKRVMSPKAIVRAIENFLASGMPIPDNYHVLNFYR